MTSLIMVVDGTLSVDQFLFVIELTDGTLSVDHFFQQWLLMVLLLTSLTAVVDGTLSVDHFLQQWLLMVLHLLTNFLSSGCLWYSF